MTVRAVVRMLVLFSLFAGLTAADAHASGKRLALVIGVDAYANLPPLQKAVGDARAVAAVLRDDLGFDVRTAENPTRREFARKLAELDSAITSGDTVLFFFAGHGVALSTSENVLLPADIASPATGQEGLVRDDGFVVDAIIRRFQQRGAAVTMMILDACRDNPFEQAGVRSIGVTRGLARIEAPQGVFVLFSAGLGQRALDRLPGTDTIPTSVFTRHLVSALRTPGLSHVQIAKRVQAEVAALARTVSFAQQPAYYDQIEGDVILRAGPGTVSPSNAALTVPSLPPQPRPRPAPEASAEVAPYVGSWKGKAAAGSENLDYSVFIEPADQSREVRGTITVARPDDASRRATYAFSGTVSNMKLSFKGTVWLSGDRETFCIAAGALDLRMVRMFDKIVAATLTGTWGPSPVDGGCKTGTRGGVRLDKVL